VPIDVSFTIMPRIKSKKTMTRGISIMPLSPTAKFGMDMLENALKNADSGGG